MSVRVIQSSQWLAWKWQARPCFAFGCACIVASQDRSVARMDGAGSRHMSETPASKSHNARSFYMRTQGSTSRFVDANAKSVCVVTRKCVKWHCEGSGGGGTRPTFRRNASRASDAAAHSRDTTSDADAHHRAFRR
eukprot:7036531-Prymnesium_polylepis.1